MNTPDIIAIVALFISSVVSIASLIISYVNNKLVIGAKRSEMVLEKRLEVFSVLVEKVQSLVPNYQRVFHSIYRASDRDAFISETDEKILDFAGSYIKSRIYIPKNLQSTFSEYLETLADYQKNYKEWFRSFDKYKDGKIPVGDIKPLHKQWKEIFSELIASSDKLITAIQYYIGLE